MAQYIDKNALIAEIERRYEINLVGAHGAFRNGKIEALREMKDFLNTLEVKEVNLEKEFDSFLNDIEGVPPMWHSEEQIEWGKDIARHFYELGLAQQNDKQNE